MYNTDKKELNSGNKGLLIEADAAYAPQFDVINELMDKDMLIKALVLSRCRANFGPSITKKEPDFILDFNPSYLKRR